MCGSCARACACDFSTPIFFVGTTKRESLFSDTVVVIIVGLFGSCVGSVERMGSMLLLFMNSCIRMDDVGCGVAIVGSGTKEGTATSLVACFFFT